MAKDPAFLMYYREWLVSTAGWDADIRGWYINLLCHQADKPEGLPGGLEGPALETLAELAGVKISQFERFKDCWKRTLKAQFQADENGNLINPDQKKILDDRKDYSTRQSIRGLIGYFIKLAKREYDFSEPELKKLYRALEQENLLEKSKDDRELCYKRTLIAHKTNAIANAIANKNKIGGVGERKNEGEKQFPKFPTPENVNGLPEGKILLAIERYKITQQTDLTKKQVLEIWEVFKPLKLTGEKYYPNVEEVYTHFCNWIQTEKFKRGKEKSTHMVGRDFIAD